VGGVVLRSACLGLKFELVEDDGEEGADGSGV
jgi:hypothetical protein